MGKRTIKLTVENEYVSGAGVPIGAAGSHDEVEMEVTFVGDVWLVTDKYVTFRDALGRNPNEIVLKSEMVKSMDTNEAGENMQTYTFPVPGIAKTYAGESSVTFTGYTLEKGSGKENSCITTTTAYFRVLPSDYSILDDESMKKDPTLAQQVQSMYNAWTEEDGYLARTEAALGKLEGEDGYLARTEAALSQLNGVEGKDGLIKQTEAALSQLNGVEGKDGLIKQTEAALGELEGEDGLIATTQKVKQDAEYVLSDLNDALTEIIAIQDDLIDGITIYVLPEVTQDTEGYVLVAENGAYTLKNVAETEVDTYIDECINKYIDDALGGEY